MTAIPGPTASASLQTARWLARPIRFLEDNRRRYGDAFTVMFKGFKTPLVIVSHPSVLRALYGERGHLMPPGRQVTLKPLVGARSLLLLEGAEHLSRRKVMLPPFRGDRMRAYEPIMRDASARELAALAGGSRVRRASEHAVDHARRDPPGRLRRRRTRARRARLHQLLGDLLAATTSMSLQVQVLFGRMAPLEALQVQAREIDSLLLRGDRGAAVVPRRGHLLVAGAGPLRGRRNRTRMERRRDPRPADDVADGRARDHRHRSGVDARSAGAPPRTCSSGRADGRETYLKAVVSESLRLRPVVPLGRAPAGGAAGGRRPVAAGGHGRDAGDVAHPHPPRGVPGAVRVPPRAVPGEPAVDLHVDPVRRRRAALHRRPVRRARDARRAGRGAGALRPAPGRPRRRGRRPPQRHLLPAPRHARRSPRRDRQESGCQRANFSRAVLFRLALPSLVLSLCVVDVASAASPRVGGAAGRAPPPRPVLGHGRRALRARHRGGRPALPGAARAERRRRRRAAHPPRVRHARPTSHRQPAAAVRA